MWRIKWIGLGAIVLVALASWALQTTPEVQITTAPVTAGSITRRVFATGTLQAVTTVEVGTQVSGVVQSLQADYNSLVRAGQIVGRLDPSTYAAQMRSARARLGEAQAAVVNLQAAVEDAQTKFARAASLFARQLIPESDLDDARVTRDEATADLAAGQAAVVQAEAAVHEAEFDLSHTIIRSPIDGIVVDRAVDVGQTLAASVQSPVLFRIASDLAHMQVNVDVDESDVAGLQPGEPVTFDVESYPGETFHGTLLEMRLQPVAEQTTGATGMTTSTAPAPTTQIATVVSYATIIDVANPDERLRPGMTAEVTIAGSHRDDVIRIPNAALAFRPAPDVLAVLGETDTTGTPHPASTVDEREREAHQVWRYDGRRLTPVTVRTGLSDDAWTELLSGGVHPGDALATNAAIQQRSRM